MMKNEDEEVHRSGSAEETMALARALAEKLGPGAVVALRGELGAGKTLFVKGLAEGLRTDPAIPVTSPSYTLIHEYPGPLPLYHLDFYRLLRPEAALGLGLEEYFEGEGVTAVEWAEKFAALLPSRAIWVTIERTGEDRRAIRIAGL